MIIFVCTGNTCRSPMAEGFYKAATGKDAQSFGLMCQEGVPASKNAVSAMEKFGIDIKDHASRRITAEAAAAADEILCMTEEQKIMLTYAYPEYSEKIRLLSEAAREERQCGRSVRRRRKDLSCLCEGNKGACRWIY